MSLRELIAWAEKFQFRRLKALLEKGEKAIQESDVRKLEEQK